MLRTALLGLDVGGGGGRCLLLDAESGARVVASRAWRHAATPAGGGLAFDIDLEALWAGLAAAVREVVGRVDGARDAVVGIAATGMRFSSVVLDGEGRALLAVPNRDARAAMEGIWLAREFGPELHRSSGHWPLPIFAAARLRWLQRVHPERFASAATVISLSDWLAHQLCGERATDPSHASGTLLFDLGTHTWSDEWLARLELPRRLCPPLAQAGERLGALGAQAADALGLRAGIAVAQGGADSQCALLGAGVVAPGATCAVTGSSAPVQRVLDRPRLDPEARLWTEPHVVAERWVLESSAGPAGEAVEWLARVLFPDAPSPVARLLVEAVLSEPGAAGMLSTFGAQLMDGRALAVPVGDLTLSHLCSADDESSRRHLARSLLEGMAYALRANLEQLDALAGDGVPALRLAGGLAGSDFWSQLVCDVVATPVEVVCGADASALGAALCAAAGAGLFRGPAEAAAQLARVSRRHEPEPETSADYGARYRGWRGFHAARAPTLGFAQQTVLPAVLRSGAGGTPARAALGLRPRILVTAELDDGARARLEELGPLEHAGFRQALRLLAGRALVEALDGVEVFVTEVDVVDAESLRALPKLRVIAACRGDAVNVDVAAASALGIPVLHAPGRNADAVAELTLAFLLALSRRLPAATSFLRDPQVGAGDTARMGQAFSTLQGSELAGKTVGLVGFGAVGRAVARRLRGFGVRLLACDPALPAAALVRAGAEPVGLDALLAQSDFVSLHATAVTATRGLIGAAELARMRPGAFLVNTARAALVDEAALADALRGGHLAGAALDVFGVEPPGADHPLLQLPNVIVTPHVGGNTAEVAGHQGRIVAEDLERLLRGERPLHVLNPDVLECFDWSLPRAEPDAAAWAALAGRPGPAPTDLERAGAAPHAGTATPRRRDGVAPAHTVAHMQRLLADFVARLRADAELRAFSAGRDVTLHFALRDLPLDFHLRLAGGGAGAEGGVEAALGPPPAPADVSLELRAALLDGMFTGRANPMQAAMSGALSFRGDTAKAMTLRELESDLRRLWQQARDAVGAPSGLDELVDPTASAGPAGLEGGSGGVEGGDALRVELIRVVQELYGKELITATGGNVSARIPGTDELWITPGQLFKGDLRPDVLVRVGLDGKPLERGARSPSSECLMHCAVYVARPDAQAVIHVHAPHATVLVNADLPFLPVSTEAAFFGDIPRIPFVMPGTEDLARAVGEAVASSWAVLMKNHGLLVAARSLRRGADMAEIIDRSAQIILGCHAVGRPPPVLPADVVARLRGLGDLVA